jgi:hypothetical protein
VDVLNFCKTNLNTKRKQFDFFQKLQFVKWMENSDNPTSEEIDYYLGLEGSTFPLGQDRAKVEYYGLLRGYQGIRGLEGVLAGTLKHLTDDTGFIEDSLFCEWAYVINLDKSTLEVFKGFQNDPSDEEKYLPCKMVASLPLGKLTKKALMDLDPAE